MEVESQVPFSSFEDFFNVDMFAAPTTSNQSPLSGLAPSSRSSSSSPRTPPQDIDFFKFYGADELSKQDFFPNATSPFDLLASITSADPFASTSTSISGSAIGPADNASPVFAIDPQLVGTGTPLNNSSPESVEDQSSQDNGDASPIAATSPEELEIPVKVGGKGKNNRRGTVQSGGIVKKAPVIKERSSSAPQSIEENREPDDWRPSPEEYKKMSSKEKRQLRNKISARNFRVRRKGENERSEHSSTF